MKSFESAGKKIKSNEYSRSFAGFLSPEGLAGRDASSLSCICGSEIAFLCAKYKIEPDSWMRFASALAKTEEMQVA